MDTLLYAFEQYLTSHSRHTRLAYTRDIQEFIYFLGTLEVSLSTLSIHDVQQYLTFLGKKRISNGTFTRKTAALKSFFLYIHTYHQFSDFSPFLPSNPFYCPHKIAQLIELYASRATYKELRLCLILWLFSTNKLGVPQLCSLRTYHFNEQTGTVTIGKSKQVELSSNFFALLHRYLALAPYPSTILFPVKVGSALQPISRQALWSLIKVALSPQNTPLVEHYGQAPYESDLKHTYLKKHPRP